MPDCIQKTLQMPIQSLPSARLAGCFVSTRTDLVAPGSSACAGLSGSREYRMRPILTSVEDGGYDSIPLPSLVVAFKEHDAIVVCFDEEGQYMLEGSSEPTLGVIFAPAETGRGETRSVARGAVRCAQL